jgi:AcrR family transcriptional regulator
MTSAAGILQAFRDPASDDATTERILDGALQQFQLFGLRRSSVDDVARRAGLGRMTVYRRFPKKDDLVEAVVLREARRMAERVNAAAARMPTVEERAVESFVVMVREVRTNPLLQRLLTTEPETALPYVTVHGAPVIAMGAAFIHEQIRHEQKQGASPAVDPQGLAEILARLAHSILLTPGGGLPLDDDRQTREFARRYLVPLISAPTPRARRRPTRRKVA